MSVQDLDALEEKKKIFDFSNLTGDFYGGLTAGIVALPLGLAFGAGVFPGDEQLGATAGLWGAILVGFFAAAFGGTNTQISGPTGPMVVVFAGLLASLTAAVGAANPDLIDRPAALLAAVIPLLFASVVLGGVLQIVMGVCKFGKYIKLVPYTVISGFMSGIGVIIILLQTSRLFGGKPASGEVFDASQYQYDGSYSRCANACHCILLAKSDSKISARDACISHHWYGGRDIYN